MGLNYGFNLWVWVVGFTRGFALLFSVIAFGLRVWVIVSVLGYESVEVRFQEFQL